MKSLVTLLLLFVSLLTTAQNKGYVSFLNQVKATEDIEQIKKYGLNIEISPILVDVEKLPKVNNLLEDYKTYIKTYYRQINSITFLDIYQFTKLDKRNMRVQTLCYTQKKYEDYKWGGCKYFEIFHVNSDLYFTSSIKEYSDRFEMEVVVAEKVNKMN